MIVPIGVVDTGLDLKHPAFKRKRKKPEGIGVRREGDDYLLEPDFHDHHGHGTAMAARIQSFCKKARIHAVRIAQRLALTPCPSPKGRGEKNFAPGLSTDQRFAPVHTVEGNSIEADARQNSEGMTPFVPEKALALGIEWCVDQGIRIVNVSYSIEEAPDDGPLCRVCQKAYKKGVIIVAAYRNGDERPVYPAAFPTVIGVRRRDGLKPGEVSLSPKGTGPIYAQHPSNTTRGTVPFLLTQKSGQSPENLDLYAWGTSNSIATAQVSAMVGRIHSVDDCYGLEEVFAFLTAVAVP